MFEEVNRENSNREGLWRRIENNIPGIKNEFEICVLGLIMCKHEKASTIINFGYSSKHEPLLRCHVYTETDNKIFSLYYNTETKDIHIRNVLGLDGKLKVSAPKKKIESLEQLRILLQMLVIKS